MNAGADRVVLLDRPFAPDSLTVMRPIALESARAAPPQSASDLRRLGQPLS